LREKQKARRIYGVLERQFRNYFHKAEKSKGVTGETLLQMLEMRVDNILYRLGLAPSRSASRQIVRHGHVTVNGRKVSIPSYVTRPGDVVAIRAKSRDLTVIAGTLEKRKGQSVPEWLELDSQARQGRVLMAPSRQSIPVPVTEQLIVELYSK
jgi:small subunit ribosomal protein S4